MRLEVRGNAHALGGVFIQCCYLRPPRPRSSQHHHRSDIMFLRIRLLRVVSCSAVILLTAANTAHAALIPIIIGAFSGGERVVDFTVGLSQPLRTPRRELPSPATPARWRVC